MLIWIKNNRNALNGKKILYIGVKDSS